MKKGFTLIELLAVIVILAIIALIATPIVLNIINDSKESATLRNAEYYIDAVEQSIMKKSMDIGDSYRPAECIIQEDGNLICDGTDELTVEVKGNKPTSGTITFDKGKVDSTILVIDNKTITKNEEGTLVYVDTELKYTIGQEVIFNPGDGDKTWNVIDEDATTVMLMLSENLGTTYAWYKYENYNSYDNSYGPKDALEYLNSLTTNWDNVDPIESYSYINNLNGTTVPNGYQKIEIKNGVTKLTHKDGTTITDVTGVSKARLLTRDEVFEIASKTNANLKEENLRAFIAADLGTVNTILQSQGMGVELKSIDEAIVFATQLEGYEWLQYESKYYQTYATVHGMINMFGVNPTHDILLPDYLYQNLYSDKEPYAYWTLSSFAGLSDSAWYMDYGGGDDYSVVFVKDEYGVRPVITISKSKLLK